MNLLHDSLYRLDFHLRNISFTFTSETISVLSLSKYPLKHHLIGLADSPILENDLKRVHHVVAIVQPAGLNISLIFTPSWCCGNFCNIDKQASKLFKRMGKMSMKLSPLDSGWLFISWQKWLKVYTLPFCPSEYLVWLSVLIVEKN